METFMYSYWRLAGKPRYRYPRQPVPAVPVRPAAPDYSQKFVSFQLLDYYSFYVITNLFQQQQQY